MHIAILGRQPVFGMAELECLYGSNSLSWFNSSTACIDSPHLNFDFNRLGGSQKAGRVILDEQYTTFQALSNKIIQRYATEWRSSSHKITLGISVYDLPTNSQAVQKIGLHLKKLLREYGVSLRVIPNREIALNTATSHHNKLGLSEHKVELLIVGSTQGRALVAESIGAQNISALAARDQARPKTDAFVGMLPPKLARILVNMGTGLYSQQSASSSDTSLQIVDPFCGTGVVLQEALLLGYSVYGSDLSDKMVDYSRTNLRWLQDTYPKIPRKYHVELGNAVSHTWKFSPTPVVISETYLGQPFSAPPSPEKLREVRATCNGIVRDFLLNIHPQLPKNAVLCLAVPAWRNGDGKATRLPLRDHLNELGYQRVPLTHVADHKLLYFRETQVVARDILLLQRLS
jgi:tRNA G10  N-methylase Trm11